MKAEISEFFKFFVGGEMLKKIVTMVSHTVSEKAAEHAKSKLPLLIGLSLEDERIWARLWAQLNDEEQKALTDFLADECKDYECNHFRYVVVGIPDQVETITTTGTGNKKRVVEKNKSYALEFLKDIARVIQTYGTTEAKRRCMAGNIMGKNPFVNQAMDKWKRTCEWFKDSILVPLKATSLQEVKEKAKEYYKWIDEQAKILNDKLEPVEDYFKKRKARPLWKRLLWH